jgi:hypothetical protein
MAVGVIALMASTVSAKTYTLTYTGFLTSGTDTSGVFGDAGSDLTHDAYTAVFMYDTALGTQAGSTAIYNQICGGEDTAGTGCLVSGVLTPVNGALTINDITEQLLGTSYGSAATGYDTYNPPFTSADTIDLTGGRMNYLSDYASGFDVVPSSLQATLAKTISTNLLDFQIGGGGAEASGRSEIVNGDSVVGTPGTVMITADGVAEPKTWLMMLVGFGGLGVARRVARRKPLSAALPGELHKDLPRLSDHGLKSAIAST